MNGAGVVLAVIVVLAGAYQLYVSWRVCQSEYYAGNQRTLQLIIVWLVPVIGAIACHLMLSATNSTYTAISGSAHGKSDAGYDDWHDSGGSGDGD